MEIRSQMNTVYALLKPDNFLQNTLFQSVDILQKYGYNIIDYKIIRVSDELSAKMYAEDFNPTLDFYTFNKRLFHLAPAVAMILNTDTEQEIFARQKGAAIPLWITDTSKLRYQMGAQSRLFNRIHIPQTTQQATTEQLLTFGIYPKYDKTLKHLKSEVQKCGYMNVLPAPDKLWEHVQWRVIYALPSYSPKNILRPLSSFHKKQVSMWTTMASLTPDPIFQHIIEIIINFSENHKKRLLYQLDYLWTCLALKHIFVSDIEKYHLTAYFIYPTN